MDASYILAYAADDVSYACVQDRMDFLRRDLCHLFDEQGIDRSAYEEKVNFEVSVHPTPASTGLICCECG